MTSDGIQRRLAPVTDSAPRARYLLDGLEGVASAEKLDHLRLLVSELVTNSILHAGLTEDEGIDLVVSVRGRRIRVEVHDGGPGFERPFPRTPDPEQIGGRGLYLVDLLSNRWGVESGEPFCVWFEIID